MTIVKLHTRKTKSGKVTQVRDHYRKMSFNDIRETYSPRKFEDVRKQWMMNWENHLSPQTLAEAKWRYEMQKYSAKLFSIVGMSDEYKKELDESIKELEARKKAMEI